MLHGAVLRSPYAHARIKSINFEKAAKLDGVKAIVTRDDFPVGIDGDTLKLLENTIAGEFAYYDGHAIAAVAATSVHVAKEAINEIEIRISQIQVEINHLTKDLPSELINEYESLRSRPGHVSIAKLVNRTCNGCNLELPAVEVDRIKKISEDSIINCEECGCILVR